MYKQNKYIFAKFMHSNYMHNRGRNGHSLSTCPHTPPAGWHLGATRNFITLLRANYVTYRHIYTYGVYKKMCRNKINIYLHIHVTLGVNVAAIEIATHGSWRSCHLVWHCNHLHQSRSNSNHISN